MSDFEVGDRVKVRKLQGEFKVTGLRRVGRIKPRYQMKLIPDTGGYLEETEAFSEDMQLAPRPEPAPELALAPDPPAPDKPAQDQPDASPDAAAPAAERSAADAISSPGDTNFALDAGAFGGELDEYSPGAQIDHTHDPEGPGEEDGPWADGWEKRSGQSPKRKKLRPPTDSIFYHQLKDIMYSGRFAILDDADDEALNALDKNTPVGVAATRERNGSAVWIIVADGRLRKAMLEMFYPTEAHEESRAIEHAVMLALREVPIRTPDLEVLLLQL